MKIAHSNLISSEANKCKWEGREEDNCDCFITTCGKYIIHDAAITDNEYKYCPYCGKEIEEVKEIS